MNNLIGREKEIRRLNRALEEREAQLIIVYGRRRVGKTFLINEYFGGDFSFKFTGAFGESKKVQLKNFVLELNRQAMTKYDVPQDWSDAFALLRDYLESKDKEKKQVVFFDEMPWMDRQKSGFLPAFEWFWNSWGSSRENLVFIVCGSATSWMIDKLENNKGGLFNRQTCRLYLEPFNLHDTELYLKSRDIYWSRYDITVCYMIMGGIPYYLKLLDRSLSLNENIDALFFEKRSELWDEFEHLYNTLFSNSDNYIRIVEALSKKRSGLTRNEISKASGVAANGVLSKMLTDLINSGFVRINDIFGRKKRDIIYQLSDYYSLFYFRFIKDNYGKDEHLWSNSNDNPARRSWEGLTFEQICKDHIQQIKNKIGIAGVMTEISSWSKQGNDEEDGVQIDLLIDRQDHVINVCEIKYSLEEILIDKEYERSLRNKISAFVQTSRTKKTIQLTMITTYGVKKNMYSNMVSSQVILDDLFQ